MSSSYSISELSDHVPKDNWTVGSDTPIQESKMNQTEIDSSLQKNLYNLAETLAYQPEKQEHQLIPVTQEKIESNTMEQLIHKVEAEKQSLLAHMPLVPDRQSVARVAAQSHEEKMDSRKLQQTINNQLSERGYTTLSVAASQATTAPHQAPPVSVSDEFTSDDVRRYVFKVTNGIPSITKKLSESEFIDSLKQHHTNDYVRYLQLIHERQVQAQSTPPVPVTVQSPPVPVTIPGIVQNHVVSTPPVHSYRLGMAS
jgi:hypothetical protein